MSKYFSYCPQHGYETHDTAEDAKKSAKESIAVFQERAMDGWDDDVNFVSWGEVKQVATETNKRSVAKAREEGLTITDDVSYVCDFELRDVKP